MPGIREFLSNLFRAKSGNAALADIGKQTPSPEATKSFKIVTTMVNSVTLSSDMTKLYVIDNGRAIVFDLEAKNGVILGTLDGQITAATALPVIAETGEGGANTPAAAAPRAVKSFKVDTSKGQWTMFFIKDKTTLGVIGAVDIDFGVTGGTAATECKFELFNVGVNTLNIKRTGIFIEFTLRLAPGKGGVEI